MGATLIAYATKHGSTREVAQALADALREKNLEVAVEAARTVRDLGPYDTVVLGAPLYRGRWHRDAAGFLKRHCEALANRDVAIFALGPRTPTCDGGWPRCRAQLEDALHKPAWLSPVSVALFGGVDPPTRKADRRDQRDWDAIRAWAMGIAERALASR